jgi:sortase A
VKGHRRLRRAGTVFLVGGVALFAYAAAVVFWRDPFTDLYTAYQQHELRASLARDDRAWVERLQVELRASPLEPPAASAPAARHTAQPSSARAGTLLGRLAKAPAVDVVDVAHRLATSFAREHRGHDGQALGRIVIPRFGLSEIFVEGTDYWRSLTKGPGRYAMTSYPGLGRTTAIAGHRTTWSAPFRHIDELRAGDPITLRMPYGTFVYRVQRHEIVDNGDWSIIRPVGYDELVLSACHPLYSAAQRYVVFARLASIELPGASTATRI